MGRVATDPVSGCIAAKSCVVSLHIRVCLSNYASFLNHPQLRRSLQELLLQLIKAIDPAFDLSKRQISAKENRFQLVLIYQPFQRQIYHTQRRLNRNPPDFFLKRLQLYRRLNAAGVNPRILDDRKIAFVSFIDLNISCSSRVISLTSRFLCCLYYTTLREV